MSNAIDPKILSIMEERFGHDELISVATINGKRPAVRTVNGYYEEGSFYTVTYALSNKMKQIKNNPTVAICGEWFTANGIGENMGHIRAEQNTAITTKLREVFASWYDNGHVDESDPNTCILRIWLTDGILFSHGTKYEIDFTSLNIQYRQLHAEDINPDILKNFNRYQEVIKSWRKSGEEYALEDTPFIEDWSEEEKKQYILNGGFHNVIRSGGSLFGAFIGNELIGFSLVTGEFIGSKKQYLQLNNMHVSYEYRHKGIGKELFLLCVDTAKRSGVQKLYISAHSSEESQAFYKSMGCIHAEEIIPELYEAEPYDVHLEYML